MKNYKAGKELNILIVEKVLGRVSCEHWEHYRAGQVIQTDKCPHDLGECYPQSLPAQYSENAEAANRVVEEIVGLYLNEKKTSEIVCVVRAEFLEGEMIYSVGFVSRPEDMVYGAAITGTLPLSICIAALNYMDFANLEAKKQE